MKCKYCGKECKNKNSLIQHEIRCHSNSNRLTNCGNHGATKGYNYNNHGTQKLSLQKVNINKKYHYLYKITNNINGKFYYGIHSTNDLDDNYMGSGKLINIAYKKYGYDNFKKEIIEFFDNREKASKAEHDIVTKDLVNDSNCYNLTIGGDQGICNAFKGKHHTKENRELFSLQHKIPDNQLKQKRRMMSKDGIMKSIPLKDIESYKKKGWVLGGYKSKYERTWQEYKEELIKKKEERLKKIKEHNDNFWKEFNERDIKITKSIQQNINNVDISKFGWLKELSNLTGYPQYTLRKKIKKKFPNIFLNSYKKKSIINSRAFI